MKGELEEEEYREEGIIESALPTFQDLECLTFL